MMSHGDSVTIGLCVADHGYVVFNHDIQAHDPEVCIVLRSCCVCMRPVGACFQRDTIVIGIAGL